MSQPLDRPDAARNLLFGVLALQVNFLSRAALVAAAQSWAGQTGKPLSQVLVEQGRLTASQVAALDALVAQHLAAHGDAETSLQTLSYATGGDGGLAWFLGSDGAAGEGGGRNNGAAAPGRCGRYRILRPHAKGGLGEVSVAEDTELRREVALKEIQERYADDPAGRRRFLFEAEVTAALEHPGVVPVYGRGTDADGRPYYAMRFIRGESLKEAIRRFFAADNPGRDPGERRLARHQLLRRFIDVCNAVAYAHSRGVLHRDLKPANVMLGLYGETLVVDWGLAKAGVGPRVGPDEATVDPALCPAAGDPLGTQAGSRLGTPAFMSPEQAAGRLGHLGPASDVYSLGATLYVLLTGRSPFDGVQETEELLLRVQEGQFPPPRQVRPDTPPALDAVCRKAMAREPSARYATALDLAAEVEHWLADEPVAAYREPWASRLARRARRHRTAVVAAGVFLACAVVALSASTALVWREQRNTEAQRRLAEDERTRAQRNFEAAEGERARAVRNYEAGRALSLKLIDIAESGLARIPQSEPVRKDLLAEALRAQLAFLGEYPDDPKVREETARLHRYKANLHRFVHETASAEQSYRESIRIQEALLEQYPEELDYRQSLCDTLRDHSQLLRDLGRLREAAGALRRSAEGAEHLLAADPNQPGFRRALAAALLDLSWVENTRGEFAAAGTTAGRAAELFRGLLDAPPENRQPLDPLLLAASLTQLAISGQERGATEPALAAHAEAVALLTGMVRKGGAGVKLDDVLHFLGWAVLEQSRAWAKSPDSRARAEKRLGQAILQWEEMSNRHPTVARYREARAVALQVRGQLLADLGRPAEARADFDNSRLLLEKLVRECPEVVGYRGALGRAYAGLGRLARGAGDGARAADWSGKAAGALRRAVEESPDNARDRRSLEEVLAGPAK